MALISRLLIAEISGSLNGLRADDYAVVSQPTDLAHESESGTACLGAGHIRAGS